MNFGRTIRYQLLLLLLCLEMSCSRPVMSGVEVAPAAAAADSHPERGLPFRDAELPSGTQLTVRLEGEIRVEPGNVEPGKKDLTQADAPTGAGTFEALMAEPVILDGNVMVPQGASASGRIEAAQAPVRKGAPGSLRLLLDSITLAGKELPIHTSSLFIRGDLAAGTAPGAVTLEKGHRLTFRLSEPVLVSTSTNTQDH